MTEQAPPLLLTPGPLTTSARTREALTRDWGSREADFLALTHDLRGRLLRLVATEDTHSTVPLQGSGTFALEAMLGSLVPRQGKVLVVENGAYGRRLAEICRRLDRAVSVLSCEEGTEPLGLSLDTALARDPAVTHVAAVHVETSSGVLNPVQELAQVARAHGRPMLLDAISSFGALELDAATLGLAGLAATANKCLEGVPGLSFVVADKSALELAKGNSPSLVLDLHDQWAGLERDAQWRFTPPTQVVAALCEALDQHAEEGGVAGRGKRYRENCAVLRSGMVELGFWAYLPESIQAPIIVTFREPRTPAFDFRAFHGALRELGFVIYPGKLTREASFRIGCIGHVQPDDLRRAVEAVSQVVAELGVTDLSP